MLLPLHQDEWKLLVNTNYQEVMKTLMSLVTASLVLPLFLIRTFLGVREGESIAHHLRPWGYISWGSMFLSLACGMSFFFASAKFLKVVSGGTETWTQATYETLRDFSIWGAAGFFGVGLVALLGFFTQSHISKGDSR